MKRLIVVCCFLQCYFFFLVQTIGGNFVPFSMYILSKLMIIFLTHTFLGWSFLFVVINNITIYKFYHKRMFVIKKKKQKCRVFVFKIFLNSKLQLFCYFDGAKLLFYNICASGATVRPSFDFVFTCKRNSITNKV